jgi:hypothetical protein
MSHALTVYERMNEMTSAANALHASGFFSDVKTQAQAMVKVMAGAEIGLPPFAAMSGIHIVQGKPVLGANLIATLVKNDPRYDYRVKTADNGQCVLTWYEGGKVVGESSFTMNEANAAGLTNKDNWRKYPSDMLFARALTRGARRYAPGIFGGAPIYTPEEMGVDTDEEGHIIEGQIVTPPAPQPARAQQPATNGNASAVTEAYRRSDEMHPNDPGPLADDEQVVADAKPGEFVNTAAALLVTDAMTIKRHMAAHRVSAPRNQTQAVEAFRVVKAAMNGGTAQQQPAQADWLNAADDDAAKAAALATARGELD